MALSPCFRFPLSWHHYIDPIVVDSLRFILTTKKNECYLSKILDHGDVNKNLLGFSSLHKDFNIKTNSNLSPTDNVCSIPCLNLNYMLHQLIQLNPQFMTQTYSIKLP